MRGTILDFLRLAAEKPDLANELVELAAKHDFQFTDDVSDEELEGVAGGAASKVIMYSLTGGGLPDGLVNPTSSPPSASSGPLPYPNTGGSQSGSVEVGTAIQHSGARYRSRVEIFPAEDCGTLPEAWTRRFVPGGPPHSNHNASDGPMPTSRPHRA